MKYVGHKWKILPAMVYGFGTSVDWNFVWYLFALWSTYHPLWPKGGVTVNAASENIGNCKT